MAIGDDAAAAGMDLVDGTTTAANTIDDEINKTRDYIATISVVADGSITEAKLGSLAVTSGKIGALAVTNSKLAVDSVTQSKIAEDSVGTSEIQPNAVTGTELANSITLSTDFTAGRDIHSGRDTSTDRHFYTNGATAATSGYVVCYINGDGRVSAGASSAVFKQDIVAVDAQALGDLFPVLHEFVMKDDPGGMVRVGYIAERLNESDDLRRFVIYKREQVRDEDGALIGSRLVKDKSGNPVPYSIDFIALLIAQTAQLHVRVAALEAAGRKR